MKILTKATKIIIAFALAGLLAACGKATQELNFGETIDIEFDQENLNKLEVSFDCPYLSENTKFNIDKKDGFTLTFTVDGEEKVIEGNIIDTKYERNDSDAVKSGTNTLEIELNEELKYNVSYSAVLEADSITLAKEDYKNKKMTKEFIIETDALGNINLEGDDYADAKLAVPSNVNAEITKEKGKYYFVFSATIDGITKYDEVGLTNYDVYMGFSVKTTEGTIIRYANAIKETEYTIQNGNVTVKIPVEKEDLHAGVDYKVYMSKGFFTNNDKSLVSDEYSGSFTYVEK